MPQSLVKILVHIVFSTKNREDLIVPELENGLYAYASGIINNHGARLITANGTENHSHFLVSLGRNDVSELIKNIKKDSSVWMKDNGAQRFYWQRGYGAFSIGHHKWPRLLDTSRSRRRIIRSKLTKTSFALCAESTRWTLTSNSCGIDEHCRSLSAT